MVTVITGNPARLRRYADALMAPDAALRDEVPGLYATLTLYRAANPDFGQDHTHLADALEAVLADAMALNADVRVVAAALASLDADAPPEAPRRGPSARFEEARTRIEDAWEQVDSLLDVVVAMDPDEWVHHVLGGWRCAPGAGNYAGSGGIRGPDGRVYPLVIPELEVDGTVAHLAYDPEQDRDPATLGGADEGWHVIDERTGVARVAAYEPSLFDRGIVFAAMTTGLQGPAHRAASREELLAIGFAADGRPVIGEQPRGAPHDPREWPSSDGPARPRPWLGHRARPTRVGGVLDMVVGALDGARVASELQNPGVNLYRVLFEEHEDGDRRRARLHTYQLSATSNGASFVPFMGYAVGGQLRRRPVTPAPPRGTSVGHGPGPTPGGATRAAAGSASGRSSRRRDRG